MTGALGTLRGWLDGRDLAPDQRLPPERRLALELGISRGELRKALMVLELDGTVAREVGRGTYLRRPLPDGSAIPSARQLAEQTSPHEAMMARMSLEPELASLAAINATPRQLGDLADLSAAMRHCDSWAGYEALDARFHNLIAEASGNALLHQLHRILNDVRVFVVWGKLPMAKDGPPPDYHSFAEHDLILAALSRHDRSGAHKAMRSHLKAILAAMIFDE